MAAVVHALGNAFDNGYVICEAREEMLGSSIDIKAYVDSHTFFNVIANDSNKVERGLQINGFASRESYRRGELKKLGWIRGKENAADVLTKKVLSKKIVIGS